MMLIRYKEMQELLTMQALFEERHKEKIKLEISGNKNDSLIRYLDNIFDGLMDGGGKYQLTKLNDQKYQKKLVELNKSMDFFKRRNSKSKRRRL